MKFLLDENIAPSITDFLVSKGDKTRHVSNIGQSSIEDVSIFEIATQTNEIIITHDLDFSSIHAFSGQSKPSVIQLRIQKLNTEIIKNILIEILKNFSEELNKGVMISVDKNGLRIRELPIIKRD